MYVSVYVSACECMFTRVRACVSACVCECVYVRSPECVQVCVCVLSRFIANYPSVFLAVWPFRNS